MDAIPWLSLRVPLQERERERERERAGENERIVSHSFLETRLSAGESRLKARREMSDNVRADKDKDQRSARARARHAIIFKERHRSRSQKDPGLIYDGVYTDG